MCTYSFILCDRRPLRYNALTTESETRKPGQFVTLSINAIRDSLHQPLHGWRDFDTASAGHGNPE